jgi:hypothetical protein
MLVCCIKGCDNPVVAMGLCNKHWRRNKRYGSPVALKNHFGYGLSDEVRFNQRIRKQPNGQCWNWIAGADREGYGFFHAEAGGVKYKRAHRFSYAFYKGGDLTGMSVCHTCDNPQCVNPEHLFLGDAKKNALDRVLKGRNRIPMGEDSPHAILTEKQVRKILLDPRPFLQIASDYNITAQTISDLKNRRSWKSLSDVTVIRSKRIGNRGEKCPVSKLKKEAVIEIRSSSMRGKDLATKFGVSQQTVTDIRKNRSWKHIN